MNISENLRCVLVFPVVVILLTIMLNSCFDNPTAIQNTPYVLMKLEYADPWYGWKGSLIRIVGTNMEIPGDSSVEFRAYVGSAQAEVIDVGSIGATIRVPDSADGDGIRFERHTRSGYSSELLEFRLINNELAYDRIDLFTRGLYGHYSYVRNSDKAGVEAGDSLGMVYWQFTIRNSDRRERSYCPELSGHDTVRVCEHGRLYGQYDGSATYDHHDALTNITAVIDTARGVLSYLELSSQATGAVNISSMIYNSHQSGRTMIVRDIPYVILEDGTLNATLTGAQVQSKIAQCKGNSSYTRRNDTTWSNYVETLQGLVFTDTTTLIIRFLRPQNY